MRRTHEQLVHVFFYMSFSRVYSAQTIGLRATIVSVEVDITKNTLHAFTLVGLPDKAVDESKDRVSGALKNSGFISPKTQNQKVVVSLSPADIKKEGPIFDMAIALVYLIASEQIVFNPEGKIFLGELALNGEVKAIRGTLPLVKEAKARGYTEVYVPKANAKEAALIRGIHVFGVETLTELFEHLNEKPKEGKVRVEKNPEPETQIVYKENTIYTDFSDVKGQESAKRGLEIAAAGGHNIIMSGPPGTGKTMLARAFVGIIPELTLDEILEVTAIHSVSGTLESELIIHPPLRAPHHSASYVSMVGGGTFPKPGEVTLAHHGVLFLDEFPEFEKRVIESLRQPLEDHTVSVTRAKGSITFPTKFILVAAMNPCPCGNYGVKDKTCKCSAFDISRYSRKLSGPILDRIDLWVTVGAIDYDKLTDTRQEGETSKTVKDRVRNARKIQKARFKNNPRNISTNNQMSTRDLSLHAVLSNEIKQLLNQTAEKLQLSARSYHRVIKLARTIADLDNKETIEMNHILEALQYRPKITY